jgi:hypothetical protein
MRAILDSFEMKHAKIIISSFPLRHHRASSWTSIQQFLRLDNFPLSFPLQSQPSRQPLRVWQHCIIIIQ